MLYYSLLLIKGNTYSYVRVYSFFLFNSYITRIHNIKFYRNYSNDNNFTGSSQVVFVVPKYNNYYGNKTPDNCALFV